MEEQIEVKELEHVVVLFSGDSGDGMQLAGNIFSNVSATVGNGISTFPDYRLPESVDSEFTLVQVKSTHLETNATCWLQ